MCSGPAFACNQSLIDELLVVSIWLLFVANSQCYVSTSIANADIAASMIPILPSCWRRSGAEPAGLRCPLSGVAGPVLYATVGYLGAAARAVDADCPPALALAPAVALSTASGPRLRTAQRCIKVERFPKDRVADTTGGPSLLRTVGFFAEYQLRLYLHIEVGGSAQ